MHFSGAVKEHLEEHFKGIGQNLIRLREERGLTQEQLAHMSDVERSTISRLENGHVTCQHATLLLLAKALNVNIHELIPATQ